LALAQNSQNKAENEDLPMPWLLETLVRSTSMDMANDPRFFTENVIDKRLSAFMALATISGLMLGTAVDEVNGMKKDFDYEHFGKDPYDALFQIIGFVIMSLVAFANLISTYVGVAQPYHVYRLRTSGPTGFEAATSYYLNKNITWWRHYAVKCMLQGLPLLFLGTGVRLVVKFDKDAWVGPALPEHIPAAARMVGLGVFALYGCATLLLYYVHWKHTSIFSERYHAMVLPHDLMASVDVMMSAAARGEGRGMHHV